MPPKGRLKFLSYIVRIYAFEYKCIRVVIFIIHYTAVCFLPYHKKKQKVGLTGLEPATSPTPKECATNCATARTNTLQL